MTPSPESGLDLAGPDLRAQLAVLRHRWLAIVAVTALAAGVAAAVTYARTPLHRAETKLLIAQGDASPSAALVETMKQLARSNVVAQNVVQDLRLTTSADRVLHKLSVVTDPGAAVLTIRADDRSRTRAEQIAQAAALVFTQLVKQRFAELATDPTKPPPAAPTAIVFDPAHALPGRVDFDPWRDIGIGAGLGLLLGLLAAFLWEHLDRRLATRAAAAAAFGVPVLATIEQADGTAGYPFAGDGESLSALRAALQLVAQRRPLRTLDVTGADAEAPATFVAAGLAAAYARAGLHAILVEADVRQPWLGEALGLGSDAPGLADVLHGGELSDAVRTVRVEGGQIAVLLGGAGGGVGGALSDLLGGEAAALVVDHLAAIYDVVLLAAPPLGDSADALELARLADGVLVVARLNGTTVDEAHGVRDLLGGLGLEPVGLVLTKGRSARWRPPAAAKRSRSLRARRRKAPDTPEGF